MGKFISIREKPRVKTRTENIVSLKKEKKVIITVILLLLSVLISGCDMLETGEMSENDEQYAVRQGENYVKGELIVFLENGDNRTNTAESVSADRLEHMLSQSVETHEGFLEDADFSLESLFLQEEQLITESEIIAEIMDNMGHGTVVSYSPDKYQTPAQAEKELIEELSRQGIEANYVAPNYKFELDIPEYMEVKSDNAHEDQEWNYQVINLPPSREIDKGSSDVKIAVLDSGVDRNHGDLKDFIDEELGRSFIEGEEMHDFSDEHGHGTHVAGIIASYGNVSGVKQAATLIPVKVMGEDGQGEFDNILEGIIYAAGEGADIINLSIGGTAGYRALSIFNEKFKEAREKGSLPVVAAGNSGEQIDNSGETGQLWVPAASEYAVTVGALDEPPFTETRADFSNYGESLDVMAPGVSILSTLSLSYSQEDFPDEIIEEIGEYKYAYVSGTSMAAPHISGMAGLLRSVESDLTVEDLQEIIYATAHRPGASSEYGWGIIDVYRGVSYAILYPAAPPPKLKNGEF